VDAYLAALRGVLLASGERLAPATLAAVVATLLGLLRSAVGIDEGFRYALGAALGAACRHCSDADLSAILAAGPLAPPPPASAFERHAGAVVLASAALHAPGRLAEPALLRQCGEAAARCAKDADPYVRVAAARAAARLAIAAPAAAPGLATVMMGLLGGDQSSEVQRQMLLALKTAAASDAGAAALEGQGEKLLPSACAIVQTPQNSLVKSAAEHALRRLLRLGAGGEEGEAAEDAARARAVALGGTARAVLTEAYIKRLARLDEDSALDFGGDDF